jgi:hypothetical protein
LLTDRQHARAQNYSGRKCNKFGPRSSARTPPSDSPFVTWRERLENGARLFGHGLAEHRHRRRARSRKDERAKRFYISCVEFIEYPADSRSLFLPIETVIAAFG